MKKFTDKINESVENGIPTAKEFFSNDSMGLSDENYDWLAYDSVVKRAIEFAKIHVEAALKEALNSVEYADGNDSAVDDIDEESILNSYPLDNIK